MLNNSNKTALNYAFERFNNNGDDYYCEELLKKGTKIPENLLNNPKFTETFGKYIPENIEDKIIGRINYIDFDLLEY